MSLKKLFSDEEKALFKEEYHSFIQNKKDENNETTMIDFFSNIKQKYRAFNKYSNRQLMNQIIASRRIEGNDNWPNLDDYSNYISLLARSFLKKTINSCLLAVEVYNKPSVNFRTENYIILMMISWTSALHAFFHDNKIRYKEDDSNYYDLSKCIEIYLSADNSFEKNEISENILFLYNLRNEITHRSTYPIDEDVFGECQACLFNLQDFLFNYWGEEFQIGYSLAHSLQFSRSIRHNKLKALKKYEASKIEELNDFINEYRERLRTEKPEIYNSPRFSFKVFMIPKLANKDKNSDIAVEFIKFTDISDSEHDEKYEKLLMAIKDINVRYFRPGEVSIEIEKYLNDEKGIKTKFTPSYHHSRCTDYYKIREGKGTSQPNRTKTEYCRFNPTYNTYEYTKAWIDFLKEELTGDKLKEILKYKKNRRSKTV